MGNWAPAFMLVGGMWAIAFMFWCDSRKHCDQCDLKDVEIERLQSIIMDDAEREGGFENE